MFSLSLLSLKIFVISIASFLLSSHAHQDPSVTVFLLSVRTGAVGLTLTRANRVYLMEPAVNPALEQQVRLTAPP
jgi:hypothetical protein